ncbi:sulfatase-like hydrolase/transferase [bacterium]|nr:sulfatase-like hydrolase/transferase [bacterium]
MNMPNSARSQRGNVLFVGLFILVFGMLSIRPSHAQFSVPAVENVFLITMDGFRWEELFTGADPWLLENEAYTSDREELKSKFWFDSAEQRRSALMPFFWSEIAKKGQLYGNRHIGSEVNVSNTHVFSYPGYNEILTGFADATIDSNDKIPNRNVTILEEMNKRQGFEGQVAAFGSWDVFPFIINEERSGVPVNAGFESATGDGLTEKERWLNEVQSQTPSPWTTVRLDVFTHNYALEYVKRKQPRLVYISYGETDDFAHDKDYDQYLNSAHRTDQFIADLWHWVEQDPHYSGKTAFVIATDHGRGAEDRWIGHGGDWVGSENIWVALLGPGIDAKGEMSGGKRLYQNQLAATVAALLGEPYSNRMAIGASIIE